MRTGKPGQNAQGAPPAWHPTESPAAARFTRLRSPLTPVLAALVLIGAGVGLTIAGAQLRGSQAAVNRALTDPAATRQVVAAVSAEVTEIYSYSYTDIGATERAAQRVLAGQAAAQYRELSPVLQQAAGERLTVVTRVEQAGVSRLSSGTAQLLIFMNQTATRGHDKGSSVPAQLAVTAQLTGGQWRITSIEAR